MKDQEQSQNENSLAWVRDARRARINCKLSCWGQGPQGDWDNTQDKASGLETDTGKDEVVLAWLFQVGQVWRPAVGSAPG